MLPLFAYSVDLNNLLLLAQQVDRTERRMLQLQKAIVYFGIALGHPQVTVSHLQLCNFSAQKRKDSEHFCSESLHLEVTPRFELGNEGFADPCLTTWLCHHIRETAFWGRFSVWSGRRGSNSLPRPWQGRALPDELRPHMAPVFQHHGASGRSRTNDTRIFSPLLYQLSYRGKWRPRWGSNPRPPA